MSKHAAPGPRVVAESGHLAFTFMCRMAAELSGLLTDDMRAGATVTESRLGDAVWLLEQFARLASEAPPPLEVAR